MDEIDIEGLILTPLKRIHHPKGDILHGLKKSDAEYSSFGEAYFSCIKLGQIKGWKRHHNMMLNIIVPVGEIQFVMFDDRNSNEERFQEVVLSINNYCRLTIPPMVWMAFKGLSSECSILLNIASITHDPSESDSRRLNEIEFDWSIK